MASNIKRQLSDDTDSDSSIDESLKTTEAEKRGTIPFSENATLVCLAAVRAQSNGVVERGKFKKKKKKNNKEQKDQESVNKKQRTEK